MIKKCDVVIIGAGAAGMMCAIEAGKRGRKVVLLDHAKKIGEIYRTHMGRSYPTMAVVQVVALMEDEAKIEIEVTAVVPD